ncbi:MAG: protein kinase domain-containing protein [Planctomycetota bacterium]
MSDHLAFCPTCRLAFVETMNSIELPQAPADLNSPSVRSDSEIAEPVPNVPGYLRLERISAGGMGVIYHAIRAESNQRVAIKVIKSPVQDDYGSDRKERLLREAHALTKINHPQIVQAIETILVNDSPALVMEYVHGQPLHRWIRKHQPDYRTAATLAWQLAQAVAHAHQQGVLHCDLKPHNVLVTSDEDTPSIKLIDFGLAKLSDEEWHITQSGDVLGTPAYMAPEQTTGHSLLAHPATDIYGLGTILYELLTARAPFDASNSTMLLAKVARESPQRPRKLRRNIPVDLERICLKCLEKAPEDRYGSAEMLAQDLQAFLNHGRIVAKEPSVTKKLLRLLRAHRAISAMLLIVGGLTITGAIMFWHESRVKSQLQASIEQAATRSEVAAVRADRAEEAVLQEMRINLEETTERLFGSPPQKNDSEWQALERLSQRWSRFADRIEDSYTSQLVRAEAWMRIGSIHATLGDLEKAQEQLRRSLDLLPAAAEDSVRESRRLAIAAEAHWQLAKCLFEAGQADESDRAFRDGLAKLEQAEKLQPLAASYPLLQSKILCDYGTVLTRLSRVQDAQETLTRSISVLQSLQPAPSATTATSTSSISRPVILKQLWASRTALARVIFTQGRAAEAVELLEQAPTELAELAAQLPDDPTVQRLISVQKNTIGICQLNLGRLEASKSSFLEALRCQKKVLEAYPSRADLLKNYAAFNGSLAVVSVRLRQTEEAVQYVTDSLRINSMLAEQHPGNSEYLGEKAKSLINLVAIQASANQLTEASQRGAELIELQTQLCRDNAHKPEYQYNLAAAYNIMATVQGRLGQRPQAYASFEQSQAIYDDLITIYPAIAAYRTGLWNTTYSLADFAISQQDWPRAREAYSQLINGICEPGSESLPTDSKLLAKAYLGQAMALQAIGSQVDSQACARLGAATIEPWKSTDPQGQEIFRRCLELAGESTAKR